LQPGDGDTFQLAEQFLVRGRDYSVVRRALTSHWRQWLNIVTAPVNSAIVPSGRPCYVFPHGSSNTYYCNCKYAGLVVPGNSFAV